MLRRIKRQMNLISKKMVDLDSRESPGKFGHVSQYRLANGNKYLVYFIEARYFGFDEFHLDTDKLVNQGRSLDDYDYRIDSYFHDEARDLGWCVDGL